MYNISFEVDALFGGDTSTLCDNSEIVGNDIRGKFAETTRTTTTTNTSSISDVLQDDGQIGTPLTAESNQSSRKKVTDTVSPID